MMSMSLDWELTTDPPQHIDPEDIKIPTSKGGYGKGGYGGAKGQTESEKLADRLAFVCSQINAVTPDNSVTNIFQLQELIDKPNTGRTVKAVFDLCVALMQ